jgi:hypothetical protein
MALLGIDHNRYNSDSLPETDYGYKNHKASIENPPKEIYEYQNFFILKDNEKYFLLDGFRRLLWYNAPDMDILVRIYDREKMSDKDILTMMVNLNHHKFYGGSQKFYDRGFALLLVSVFGIDILKFASTFNAYLISDKVKATGYMSGKNTEETNESVKSRIMGNFFISDMNFVQGLQKNGSVMLNKYIGALIYQKRIESNKAFSIDAFLKLHDESSILKNLLDKLKNFDTRFDERQKKIESGIKTGFLHIYIYTCLIMFSMIVIN